MRLANAAVSLLLASPCAASNFNDFMPGAKGMGMGMAYSAIADDAYAMFYNPAGTANAPYIQSGMSLGRMLSPVGTMSFGALTYLRPYEPINTATVGAGYYVGRQHRGGDKDEFLFHYAQELKVSRLPLTRPLKVGGNFKFINVEGGGGSGFGVGFDGGVLLRSGFGLTGSAGVRDLTTNVGVPHPTLYLGSAYTHDKWLTFAGDMRVRSNLTEFYPGVEAAFHQGLLKVRMGRGFQLDGVSLVALGLGVNFSPIVLDVAMTVPTGGIHRPGGAYQLSFSYKFGAPSFAGNFIGQAAAQAESLRAEIGRLEENRKSLESQTKTSDVKREIAEGELKVVQQRVREVQEQYRLLQKRRDEVGYAAEEAELRRKALEKPESAQSAPVIRAPPPKSGPVWPRQHEIRPGDTLRSLARTYYGDDNLWELIYEANKDKIERGLPQPDSVFAIPEPSRR